MALFGREKKNLVRMTISLEVPLAQANEAQNRVTALLTPYADEDVDVSVSSVPRGGYGW